MISTNTKEDYLRAMKMGLKEQKEAEAAGLPVTPAVLDEVFPEAAQASSIRNAPPHMTGVI